jgi:hypothetical protein
MILGAHLEGYIPKEIDERMGLSKGTAKRTLTSYGLKGKLRIPEREYMQYAKLYMEPKNDPDQRWSLSEIAEKYERSSGTVKTYLLILRDYKFKDGTTERIRIRFSRGHKRVNKMLDKRFPDRN